jgi:hypothetical protein
MHFGIVHVHHRNLLPLVLLVAVFTPPVAGQLVPYHRNWDWEKPQGGGTTRDLRYAIDEKCELVPVDSPEGFNLKEAINEAAASWNGAEAGWLLTEDDNDPHLNIKCDWRTGKLGRDFDKDPNSPGVTSLGSDVLGFFLTGPIIDGHIAKAEIQIFRGWKDENTGIDYPFPWGIDNRRLNDGETPPGPVDVFFDPVIVALHEFGHAFRLDHKHTPPPNEQGVGFNFDNGSVMRTPLVKGQHAVNSTGPGTEYNPSQADTNSAFASASVPEPATLGLLLLGLTLMRRRRPCFPPC